MNRRTLHRAFTLLELMVVMAIIGLIATLVLTAVSSARRKSRDSQRISNISELRKALELHYDSQRTYPNILSALTTSTACNTSPCIPLIPKDPLTSAQYKYIQLLSGTSYHIGAVLEDPNVMPAGDHDFDSSGFLGFKGISTDCGSTSGVDRCYDLSP